MTRCEKCETVLKDNDIIYWKCTKCDKTFRIGLLKLRNIGRQKSRIENANRSLIKCPSCGNELDNGDEKIYCKCPSCGNVIRGNLKFFTYEDSEDATFNIEESASPSSALVKCPECGREISKKAKRCVHCGKILNENASAKLFCSDCRNEIPANATECPYCGCPIESNIQTTNFFASNNAMAEKSRKNITKIVVPLFAVVFIAIIGIAIYNIKVVKPKNTYNEAIILLEKGKYEEANELFNTIRGYSDVDIIQEQLKYESYAYSAINSLKKYLKNPDSYQPYEITFYSRTGGEEDSESLNGDQIEEEFENEQYPTCIMHYGAQNGFGGNTTGYALFTYDSDDGEYELMGTCDSLNEDDYDKDDKDDIYDLFICGIINIYRNERETVGDIDLNRLKTVLKNDAYSTIKIIE